MLTPEELQAWWRDLNARYFADLLPPIPIVWSPRLTSSAGLFINRVGPRALLLSPGHLLTPGAISPSQPEPFFTHPSPGPPRRAVLTRGTGPFPAGRAPSSHPPPPGAPRRARSRDGVSEHRLIRLSIPLLANQPAAEVHSTLAHEMIHQWQYDIRKRRPNHGDDFRQTMAAMNRDGLGITVQHSLTARVAALSRYTWQCVRCGRLYLRHRRTIRPHRHRCGMCTGRLQELSGRIRADPDGQHAT
jgi:predicted SprT family Zn-dependent metalloprotease